MRNGSIRFRTCRSDSNRRVSAGQRLQLGKDSGRAPLVRLADASVREQFHQPYPLAFDLEARKSPWADLLHARLIARAPISAGAGVATGPEIR